MTIRMLCKILITCFAVLLMPIAVLAQSSTDWNYDNTTAWKEHFSSCGGEHQSPINLDLSKALPANCPDLIFHHYNRVLPEMVTNNGHTVMLQLKATDAASQSFPHITSGGLNNRYNFYQLHFHWGKDSSSGSEHHINGKSYPAELHMVHYNAKYGSFSQAVPFQDGLAVIGIMIEMRTRDNVALSHIEHFDSILNPDANNTSSLHYSVPLMNLLPHSTRSFYRYNGSLTTPGCNEDVIWTVFDTPIGVSERQLAMLRRLKNEEGQPLEDNFRPVQELHDRVLLYRAPYSSLHQVTMI